MDAGCKQQNVPNMCIIWNVSNILYLNWFEANIFFYICYIIRSKKNEAIQQEIFTTVQNLRQKVISGGGTVRSGAESEDREREGNFFEANPSSTDRELALS